MLQSSQPDEVVVDPFMGASAAGVAALAHGRRFCGTDLATDAFALTQARLEEVGGTPMEGLPRGRARQLALL